MERTYNLQLLTFLSRVRLLLCPACVISSNR